MPWFKRLAGIGSALAVFGAVVVILLALSEIGRLRDELRLAQEEKATKQVQLDTATTFNQTLNQTVESMGQQLRDAQLADDWVRQFNVSMDAKLETTVLDLGKLFDEKPKDSRSGCDERFSDGVYERMQQHYNARKGDSVSG